MTAGQSHITSIIVERPADAVHAFMADRETLHRWSFGTFKTELLEDGTIRGESLFDGSQTLVRIEADTERGTVDYHLGRSSGTLVPRIHVRVVPGAHVEMDAGTCVLTMTAWRTATMDDNRWRRLTASHEFEIVLIKAFLEGEEQ